MIMKGYTTIEQSKKLLELGLSTKSADMEWVNLQSDDGEDKYEIFVNSTVNHLGMSEDIPAWSLSALLELMPQKIEFLKNEDYFVPQLSRYYDDTNKYICCYDNGGIEHWYIENSPLDAVYNMIIWLLENNYIKKGE